MQKKKNKNKCPFCKKELNKLSYTQDTQVFYDVILKTEDFKSINKSACFDKSEDFKAFDFLEFTSIDTQSNDEGVYICPHCKNKLTNNYDNAIKLLKF